MTNPYQNDDTQDTLVLQHRLEMAAEGNRLVYLLNATGDRFFGRITEADEEDCYILTNSDGDTRRVELSQVYKVRMIGTSYARVELF